MRTAVPATVRLAWQAIVTNAAKTNVTIPHAWAARTKMSPGQTVLGFIGLLSSK